MSEQTPRTDAAEVFIHSRDYPPTTLVPVDLARSLERELSEVTRERNEIRIALAGADISSLPSDFPTVRMAHQVRADHDKFLWQVRDTCARAEAAERELDELRRKLEVPDRELTVDVRVGGTLIAKGCHIATAVRCMAQPYHSSVGQQAPEA